ncbi:hypothetical protein ENSA5_26160 [Enhygromyxa salina]|uniref:DUF3604 domain-containing protein n=1 Tax=Enhygromyxa salina TaxID=215803 RepID=A0A2S9YAL9_9BACT|nr:DUF3604 domain-containing protein [Enhygromyxa salina]PRQ02157.1 hypothetical protein ENSA5_26160 [Enhygromyxa salina]
MASVARSSLRISALGLVLTTLALSGCKPPKEPPFVEVREPCSDNNPLRNVYFGDLHVHTSYSFDAYINQVNVDPFGAYDFARGEAVELPDADGGTQTVQLPRPLDFAAVTDHGEYLGEVAACKDPDSPAYTSDLCIGLREGDPAVLVQLGLGLAAQSPVRPKAVCEVSDCPSYLGDAWARTQEAAEAAYDRSAACSFTSFVAYEWSGAKTLSNLHRNVIFRSEKVPAIPASHFEEPDFWGLWRTLKRDCIEGLNGCDVLAIPHNTNWSNGNMFVVEYPDGDEVELAGLRAELEPLIEVFQHKGDSECSNGLASPLGAPDELCEFEKLRTDDFEDCGDGTGMQGMVNAGCVSRLDFVRGILNEGLREHERIGVNPYKLGLMASTDTHNGTPGAVEEYAFPGHFGAAEGSSRQRLTGTLPGGPQNSPGGLIAVWAEENSREAIFDAMRRRETFGTSGTRMAVRMFGGWELPDDICSRGDLVELGYERGVPMGGDLPAQPEGASAPGFVVQALKDPGTAEVPGTDLERIQIIKGWVDGEGQSRVEVFEIAGEIGGGTVDVTTCETQGSGQAQLCGYWVDPNYNPEERAWYYARVVEEPVCRWSTRDCNALEAAGEELPASCETAVDVIQERAWTSPIWN